MFSTHNVTSYISSGNFEITVFDEHDCPIDVGEKTRKPGRTGQNAQHYFPRSAYTVAALCQVLKPCVIAGKVTNTQAEVMLKPYLHMKPLPRFLSALKERAALGTRTEIDVHHVGYLRQYTAVLVSEGHHAILGTSDHVRMKQVFI
jgi:hypothetical protein